MIVLFGASYQFYITESTDFQGAAQVLLVCQNATNLYYVETLASNHSLCICIIYLLISVSL